MNRRRSSYVFHKMASKTSVSTFVSAAPLKYSFPTMMCTMSFLNWPVQLFLIWYLASAVHGNSIQSHLAHMYSEVGQTVTLTCNYSTNSYQPYLFWYKQNANQMQYILYRGARTMSSMTHDGNFQTGKFKSETSESTTSLTIYDMTVSDSAVYFCALRDYGGNYKLIFGTGTTLTVTPKTPRQFPFVYKLESSKTVGNLPNSVCLITDFPSPNKTLTIDGEDVNLNEVAVLDNSTNNVWRYSTVTWDNNKNVTCVGKYDSESFKATDDTEETCSSISIDENFQTNPSLNTMSLTVFGSRVLTAKAIIFNLMITLRLWSS